MTTRHLPLVADDALPPLSSRWMDEVLGARLPIETEATCGDCAMTPKGEGARDRAAQGRAFFDPDLKCCTYLPVLANFQVGAILADATGSPAGRESVLTRIRQGAGVTPLGLGQTSVYKLLYDENAETAGHAFGRAKALRCPHLLDAGGQCGIWRHRSATCATWYCKHTRGAVGWELWQAVKQLLVAVEQTLARHCVLELGLEPSQLKSLLEPPKRHAVAPGEFDGEADPADYARAWGAWAGREEELYRASAKLVEPLSWADIQNIGGPEVRMHAAVTRAAFAKLDDEAIPAALTVGDHHIVRTAPDSSSVTTYNTHDPLVLPRALLDALPYFDGRPTAEALRAIAKEKKLELDLSLIQKLMDFKILIPS